MKLIKTINLRFGIGDNDINEFLLLQTNKSFIIKLSLRIMILLFGKKDLIFLKKVFKEKGILGVMGISKKIK